MSDSMRTLYSHLRVKYDEDVIAVQVGGHFEVMGSDAELVAEKIDQPVLHSRDFPYLKIRIQDMPQITSILHAVGGTIKVVRR